MMKTETATIESIRSHYTEKERTKLDELKELDQRVKRPAEIFGYAYGSAGALVLGTGMCLAMEVIGASMGLGIVIGLAGIALCLTTYPIYKAILKSRRKKYAGKIFALSDEILNK